MARSSIYPPSVQPGKPHLGGEAPPGWKTYRFADLFEVVERPATLRDDEEYQLITAKRSRGGVVARERLLGKDILTKTQFYVAEDDFVISNRQIIHGGCGIVPAALDGAIVSNEYTVLRPKPVLSLDYLRYLPHTIYFQQTCFHASVGVDVEKMVFDLDQWLRFRVHIPAISEQKNRSELMLSFDSTNDFSSEILDRWARLKKAAVKEMTANCQEFAPVSSVANTFAGGTPSRAKAEYFGGGIPWVKSGDLNNRIIYKTEETLSKSGIENSAAKIVPPSSVLMAMYGAGKTAGKVSILKIAAATNQAVCSINPSTSAVTADYLAAILEYKSAEILKIKQGSGQPNLNKGMIDALEIPLPTLAQQKRIADVVSAFDRLIYMEGERLSRLAAIKRAVTQNVISPVS